MHRILSLFVFIGLLSACSSDTDVNLPESYSDPEFTINGEDIFDDFIGTPSQNDPVVLKVSAQDTIKLVDKRKSEMIPRIWMIGDNAKPTRGAEYRFVPTITGLLSITLCRDDVHCVKKFIYVESGSATFDTVSQGAQPNPAITDQRDHSEDHFNRRSDNEARAQQATANRSYSTESKLSSNKESPVVEQTEESIVLPPPSPEKPEEITEPEIVEKKENRVEVPPEKKEVIPPPPPPDMTVLPENSKTEAEMSDEEYRDVDTIVTIDDEMVFTTPGRAGLPLTSYDPACVEWAQEISVMLQPSVLLELDAFVVYGRSAGQLRITLSDNAGNSESITRVLSPNRSQFSFEGLSVILLPGVTYTLTLKAIGSTTTDVSVGIAKLSHCDVQDAASNSDIIFLGGAGDVIFDLKYYKS